VTHTFFCFSNTLGKLVSFWQTHSQNCHFRAQFPEKHTCCSTFHETGESMAMEGERPARKRLDKIPEGEPNLFPQVVEGLKKIYQQKILPVELKYKFDEFHSPTLRSTDFDAKPMVLLLGQYSTGKTSFIEFMLDRPFPGSRIGPEPTTDRY